MTVILLDAGPPQLVSLNVGFRFKMSCEKTRGEREGYEAENGLGKQSVKIQYVTGTAANMLTILRTCGLHSLNKEQGHTYSFQAQTSTSFPQR